MILIERVGNFGAAVYANDGVPKVPAYTLLASIDSIQRIEASGGYIYWCIDVILIGKARCIRHQEAASVRDEHMISQLVLMSARHVYASHPLRLCTCFWMLANGVREAFWWITDTRPFSACRTEVADALRVSNSIEYHRDQLFGQIIEANHHALNLRCSCFSSRFHVR